MRGSSLLYPVLLAGCAHAQHEETCDFKWMTQSVDHFGLHNGTFQQRYSIYADHFKPGGPIFFFQGEETYLDCANNTALIWFAEKLGGMAVSLEHRYFGESLPLGNESYTNENFKYLTLDNIMEDAVCFINMLRSTILEAKDSKCIVSSGSYGAFIITAFRQVHPDVFFGALSAAGPTMALTAASKTIRPDHFIFRSAVSQLYTDHSFEASHNISNAFNVLQDQIQTGNVTNLQHELQLCTAPPAQSKDALATLITFYETAFVLASEFNYAVASPGRTPIAYPFDHTVNIALEASSPLQILNQSLWTWYEPQGYKCINWTDSTFLANMVPAIQRVPFGYITCTFDAGCSGGIPNGTIFPPNPGACLTRQAGCTKGYNATLMTQEEIWGRYHLSPEELSNSTKIIFSVAEFDPNTPLVGAYPPETGDICRSRRLYVSGMSHREELFLPTEQDKPQVVQLRSTELQIMKEWLAYCDDTKDIVPWEVEL